MGIWLECGVEGEKYLILYVQNGVGVDAMRIEKGEKGGGGLWHGINFENSGVSFQPRSHFPFKYENIGVFLISKKVA